MKTARGLSLLELLAALAILAVLATLALPELRQHWLRAHRAEAVLALGQVQLAQERFRSRMPRYAASLDELQQSAASPQGRYRLEILAASATGYRIEARPVGPQRNDAVCHRWFLEVAAGQLRHSATDDHQQDRSSTCWPS